MLKRVKKVFIVAEISANHGQSFSRAVSLMKKAKQCGADAVKFQAYTPEILTVNADNKYFRINHPQWGGQTLYNLYEKAYTPWSWFKKLKKVSDDLGLVFFATAFDKSSVDFLEEIEVPLHKIASFELVDLPLIEYMAKTKKPLILSTGMAQISEIKEAVKTAKDNGAKDITLLKCVSNYPAKAKEMNLRTIGDMRKRFKCPVGLSDHSLGIESSLAAVALGSVMIEKHFTISRKEKTPDSFFSMEPQEFKILVGKIRLVEQTLGDIVYGVKRDQKASLRFRRSLFAVKDIKKGEVFSEANVRSIRPAAGLEPKYLSKIVAKRANKTIKKGTPLRWGLIKK